MPGECLSFRRARRAGRAANSRAGRAAMKIARQVYPNAHREPSALCRRRRRGGGMRTGRWLVLGKGGWWGSRVRANALVRAQQYTTTHRNRCSRAATNTGRENLNFQHSHFPSGHQAMREGVTALKGGRGWFSCAGAVTWNN